MGISLCWVQKREKGFEVGEMCCYTIYMFDKEFFKMAAEFVVIIGVGMLLVYVFSSYIKSDDQIAVPAQAVEEVGE